MIIPNEPVSTYHGRPAPAIGSHALLDFDVHAGGSPRRYYEKHIAGGVRDEETEAMRFGRAFHARVGERRDLAGGNDPEFVVRPPTYVNAKGVVKPWNSRAKQCEDWLENEHRTVLRPEDMAKIERMYDGLRENEEAADIMRAGQAELTIRRRDEESGLMVQCRFDHIDLDRKVWCDFKSCDELVWFPRDIDRMHYDRQNAWYHRILCDELGVKFDSPDYRGFVIGSEKTLPWSSQVYRFNLDRLIEADRKNRVALNHLAEAYEHNYWPHPTAGVVTL
jgi:hypothetical protein